MHHSTTRSHSVLLGLLLVLVAGGCAVLTVDVDVYKGPLANTESVQGEQVISLVMATKPTLVLLRDRLAVQSPSMSDDLETLLRQFRRHNWYKAGHIPEGWRYWKSELATVVNEILGLYENIEENIPPEIKEVVGEAELLVREFERQYTHLHPEHDEEGEKVWQSITNGLKKPPVEPKAATTLSNVLESYKGFFYRSTNISFQTAIFQVDKDNTENKALLDAGANAQFGALLTTSKLALDVDKLFDTSGDAASKRTEFTNYVINLAVTFMSARANLHKLWRTAVEAAGEFGDPRNASSPLHRDVTAAAADLAAFLSNPRNFAEAIKNPTQPMIEDKLVDRLKTNRLARSMEQAGVPWKVFLDGRYDSDETEKCREGIRRWLRGEEDRLSGPLLLLDALVQKDTNPFRRFGLARGPSTSITACSTVPVDVARLLQRQAALQHAALGNLTGGRLPEGMETLINEYLRIQKGKPFGERLQTTECKQLMVALTDFAQKIATLGNNAVLIYDTGSAEVRTYVQVLQSIGNSILVQVNELQHQGEYHVRLKSRGGRIAGAIQHAEASNYPEFTNWTTNSGTAKDAAEQLIMLLRAERIKLLRSEVSRTSATNVTDAVIGATGSTTNSSAKLTTKLTSGGLASTNVLTTRFEKTNDNSTVEANVKLTTTLTEASPADKLLQAIEAATEIRSGMIYLRPASSYLRSSYPASTLNRNDGQRWENMLQRHALRQTPFIGARLSGERTAAGRAALELDRQSWQSVNHIRVAGAGAANYVVAKDDVGNWYVKSFSANPSNSFRTIRNLAMFSAGNAFGSRLPIRAADGSSTANTNLLLNKQANVALEKYRVATTNTFFKLLASLGAVTNDVRTAWKESNITTNGKPVLDELKLEEGFRSVEKIAESERTEVNKAKADEEAAAADRATLSVLRALKRYHASLRTSVQSKVTDERDRAEALQKLILSIRNRIDTVIREREDALNRYEAALDVIVGAGGYIQVISP